MMMSVHSENYKSTPMKAALGLVRNFLRRAQPKNLLLDRFIGMEEAKSTPGRGED